MLINCFHCSAREIVLLDEQKIARTFSNDKGVSNSAGMENYIMVKQGGRWLNELNSQNTFSVYYAKFFRLLRFFDCMKTRASSAMEYKVNETKDIRYQSEKKLSYETRLFFQKVNIT